MSDSTPDTNLTETDAARAESPPTPVEPQQDDSVARTRDEELRGWPDEPTTS